MTEWVCFIDNFSYSFNIYLFLLLTLLQMPPIIPLLPSSTHSPSPAFTTLLPASMGYAYMHICSSADLFQSISPLPSEICQFVPCVHASGFILFFSLFCSLDLTYEWHMIILFLWLMEYVTIRPEIEEKLKLVPSGGRQMIQIYIWILMHKMQKDKNGIVVKF